MTIPRRSMYASQDFIIVSKEAVKALNNSWELAGCWQRICYRSQFDGYWRATMKEIAEEICVSERTAKRLTEKLRELGWITGERENTWESTLTWRPIWPEDDDQSANVALPESDDEPAGQAPEGHADTDESANVAPPGDHNLAPSQSANLAPRQSANLAPSPSSQTVKTNDEKSDVSSDASSTPPMLTLVGADGASSTPTIGEVADRLCQHLADRIEQNGSKRPTITQKWRDEARRMIEIDNRSERQVHNMIDWCQKSSFWCSNIMSMPTLRAKYDQMRLQAEQELGITGKSTVYRRPADDPDELAARSVIG